MGGSDAYFGFEYQIQISALLLLMQHYMLNLNEFIVETEFGHDASVSRSENDGIEKNLRVAIQNHIKNSYIQVKTRKYGYKWTMADLRDMLLKRDESKSNDKITVADQLRKEEDSVFIFITDGIIDQQLYPLLCDIDDIAIHGDEQLSTIKEQLIKSARKNADKKVIRDKIDIEILKRVIVISQVRMKDIQLRIKDILSARYRIPISEIDNKRQQITDMIRDRMIRINNQNRISGNEIEEIIGIPGIRIPFSFNKEIITINEHQDALDILDREHMIIISGEPGVGKTTIGRILVNRYVESGYGWKPEHQDAHLKIQEACLGQDDVIIFLDDVFGDIDFTENTYLVKQFNEIYEYIVEAKGKVKIVATVRENIFAKVISTNDKSRVKMLQTNLKIRNEYGIIDNLASLYLNKLYTNDSIVIKTIGLKKFENLLHVSQFIDSISNINDKDINEINKCFEISKPSEYLSWIRSQNDQSRLLLYILWSISKTNQFVNKNDLEMVFNIGKSCINIEQQGFGSIYEEALTHLRDEQKRISAFSNKYVDFIHPQLRISVEEYLISREQGSKSFLTNFVNKLIAVNRPLEQSIAAMICCTCYGKIDYVEQTLRNLFSSKYVQVHETIFRFGSFNLLKSISSLEFDNIVGGGGIFYNFYECEVDGNGNIIVNRENDLARSISIGEYIDFEKSMREINDELKDKFNDAIDRGIIADLDLYERIKLSSHIRYIYQEDIVDEQKIVIVIRLLGSDPFSFVRQSVSSFLSIIDNVDESLYRDVFISLCYDSHPQVKIEMLEDCILKKWRKISDDKKELWLDIVKDMLLDPFFKAYTATGLIDMSGSKPYLLYYTEEEKLRWFIHLAPVLIKDKFPFNDNFDRFLTKFDEYFPNLPQVYRTELLKSIVMYIQSNPDYSSDIPYTIQSLVLNEELEPEELDMINSLIISMSIWGKIQIFHSFAKNYNKLPDRRFRDLIHRVFYNETPEELILERVTIALGLLANKNLIIDNIPEPIKQFTQHQDDASEYIREYIKSQNTEFKTIAILASHGYQRLYDIGTRNTDLYKDTVIKECIDEILNSSSMKEIELVIDTIVIDGYNVGGNPDGEFDGNYWFELMKSIMHEGNIEVIKRLCDIIYMANIRSSVHNVRTYLRILYLILNHHIDEVRDYAFKLFDDHFYKIWKDVMNKKLPKQWKKEIKNTWLSDGFISLLEQKSRSFQNWYRVKNILDFFRENFSLISIEDRQSLIELLIKLTKDGRIEIVHQINYFVKSMSNRLSDEEIKAINQELYVELNGLRRLRGENEQFIVDRALERLKPKLDWSLYFDQ